MVRIELMASPKFPLDRRELMAGLGAVALAPARPPFAMAQGRSALALQLKADRTALRSGDPDAPTWSLAGPDLRFKRGDTAEISVANDLPVAAILNWRGIDGAAGAEPLTGRPPIAPGGKDVVPIALRHAGTYLCDAGLLGDGQARPSRARVLIVGETEPVPVDRDETILIEEWRLRPDGIAIAPGVDAKGTVPLYSVNGRDFIRTRSVRQ